VKTFPSRRHDGGIPFAVPAGVTAVCLNRSRRGGAKHGIFLIESGVGNWVIKHYGHKRGQPQRLFTNLENYFGGRSGASPQHRFRTEKNVLKIWRENGFDVFRKPDLPAPLWVEAPHLVFEYVPGQTLKQYFLNRKVPKADKLRVFERFIAEWGRRHFLAYTNEDRHLIQEHPTFQHVYMSAEDQRLIFFDFEIVYTQRHQLPGLIGSEIAGYIRSLLPEELDDYLRILVRDYPHPEFLHYPYNCFFRHPNPFLRLLYALDRQSTRNRRPRSKYNIALRIRDYLRDA